MARLTGYPVAVVAGSGLALDAMFDVVDGDIDFESMPELSRCSVAGHHGVFRFGRCGDQRVVVQLGRLHLYEGLSMDQVCATVECLYTFGVRTLVFTNAAGGLAPELRCGDLMAVERLGAWPCARWPDAPERIVPAFSVDGCDARGAYVWVHGPSYETRAEIAAMHGLGYSAVGMSTAPEVVRAHDLGIRTAAISCITNECASPHALTHNHVLSAARAANQRLTELLKRALCR